MKWLACLLSPSHGEATEEELANSALLQLRPEFTWQEGLARERVKFNLS